MAAACVKSGSRFAVAALIAASVGVIAWRGCPWLIGLTVLVPVLVLTQASRCEAGAIAVTYFGAAS